MVDDAVAHIWDRHMWAYCFGGLGGDWGPGLQALAQIDQFAVIGIRSRRIDVSGNLSYANGITDNAAICATLCGGLVDGYEAA